MTRLHACALWPDASPVHSYVSPVECLSSQQVLCFFLESPWSWVTRWDLCGHCAIDFTGRKLISLPHLTQRAGNLCHPCPPPPNLSAAEKRRACANLMMPCGFLKSHSCQSFEVYTGMSKMMDSHKHDEPGYDERHLERLTWHLQLPLRWPDAISFLQSRRCHLPSLDVQ